MFANVFIDWIDGLLDFTGHLSLLSLEMLLWLSLTRTFDAYQQRTLHTNQHEQREREQPSLSESTDRVTKIISFSFSFSSLKFFFPRTKFTMENRKREKILEDFDQSLNRHGDRQSISKKKGQSSNRLTKSELKR